MSYPPTLISVVNAAANPLFSTKRNGQRSTTILNGIRYDAVIYDNFVEADTEIRIYKSKDLGYSYELWKSWEVGDANPEGGCTLEWDGEEFHVFYLDTSDQIQWIRSIGRFWNESSWAVLHTSVAHFATCTNHYENINKLLHIAYSELAGGDDKIFINTYGRNGWGATTGGDDAEEVGTYANPSGERFLTCECLDNDVYVFWDDNYGRGGVPLAVLYSSVCTVTYTRAKTTQGSLTYSVSVDEQTVFTGGIGEGVKNPSAVIDSSGVVIVAFRYNDGVDDAVLLYDNDGGWGSACAFNSGATDEYNPALGITVDNRLVCFIQDLPDSEVGAAADIDMYMGASYPGDYSALVKTLMVKGGFYALRDAKTVSHPYHTDLFLLYTMSSGLAARWNPINTLSRSIFFEYEKDAFDNGDVEENLGIGSPPLRALALCEGAVMPDVVNIQYKDDMGAGKGVRISIFNHEGHNTNKYYLHQDIEVFNGSDDSCGEKEFVGKIVSVTTADIVTVEAVDNRGVLDWEVIRQGGYFSGCTVKSAILSVIANNSYGIKAYVNIPHHDAVVEAVDLRGMRLFQAVKELIKMLPPTPRVITDCEEDYVIVREIS